MMANPIQTSDVIFPELATNFSSTLASLKRSTLSISNRLRSITEDSEFVCEVADAYALPLVANERCGSWYIPPERKFESAYFKSTDGHNRQWAFSLRRLNIQILDVVGNNDGCIIVDSTRRGKSMPDALSKTVPIWCAVFNRLLFPDLPEAHKLHTPPKCVSPSEHAQIEHRLDGFARQLKDLALDVSALRKKLLKPMRPVWVTRESSIPSECPTFPDFHPVVLCTASRRVTGTEMSEGGYIQGAGDDSEGWSRGLAAQLFWQHRSELLETNEEVLPEFISRLSYADKHANRASKEVLIKPTTWLFVGTFDALKSIEANSEDAIITCGEVAHLPHIPPSKTKHVHLECRQGKLGSRDLRKELSSIRPFFEGSKPFERVVILCSSGKDLCIGAALAILCLFTNDTGSLSIEEVQGPRTTKTFIKQRLSWIMTSHPSASPSRATLQSINDFFLTSHLEARPSPQVPYPARSRKSTISELFTSLAGEWKLDRIIQNFHRDGFGGHVSGRAIFENRQPFYEVVAEHLYIESGIFRITTGLEMQVNRRWIWQLSHSTIDSKNGTPREGKQKISVHFVKADGQTVDYLYNEMDFEVESETSGIHRDEASGKELVAKADHPCREDFYKSTYKMTLSNSFKLETFEVEHQVKGPSKDYISQTWYTRP